MHCVNNLNILYRIKLNSRAVHMPTIIAILKCLVLRELFENLEIDMESDTLNNPPKTTLFMKLW